MKKVSSLRNLKARCQHCRTVNRRKRTFLICTKPNNRKHHAVQA